MITDHDGGKMSNIRIGLATAALMLSAHGLVAQQPGQTRPQAQRGMMGDSAMARQHMQTMDSLNARLDSLVGRMNTAMDNLKITAMADVINELVAQRRMMHEHMQQMMGHGHGMMRNMKGKPPQRGNRRPTAPPDASASDTGHAEHHPPE
jgi:hypothetical protein